MEVVVVNSLRLLESKVVEPRSGGLSEVPFGVVDESLQFKVRISRSVDYLLS